MLFRDVWMGLSCHYSTQSGEDCDRIIDIYLRIWDFRIINKLSYKYPITDSRT